MNLNEIRAKGIRIPTKDITVVKYYGYDNCFVGDAELRSPTKFRGFQVVIKHNGFVVFESNLKESKAQAQALKKSLHKSARILFTEDGTPVLF